MPVLGMPFQTRERMGEVGHQWVVTPCKDTTWVFWMRSSQLKGCLTGPFEEEHTATRTVFISLYCVLQNCICVSVLFKVGGSNSLWKWTAATREILLLRFKKPACCWVGRMFFSEQQLKKKSKHKTPHCHHQPHSCTAEVHFYHQIWAPPILIDCC